MKELILTLFTTSGGALLIAKGVDTLTAIYMVSLGTAMLGFTFYNLADVAKNAQSATTDKAEKRFVKRSN